MVSIKISKNLINEAYIPFFNNWTRNEVLKGGGSAGKSVATAQRLIYRTLRYIGYNSLCIRQVQNTNRDSTLAELEKVITAWKLGDLFRINKSLGNERISCLNGNEIIFRGLDDIRKLKSTTFKTGPLCYVWIEEADETMKSDCLQISKVRLRGKPKKQGIKILDGYTIPKQVTYSFNPISAEHWLKEHFFDNPKDNTYILETTYKDNNFLTKEDRENLESLKYEDEVQYQVYVLNQWGIDSELKIFHNYVIEDFEINEGARTYQGQDFGFNDPMAFTRCYVHDQELYVFHETVAYNNTISDFMPKVEEFKREYITCDNASPGDIEEMEREGFRTITSQKGKHSVYDGITYLKAFKKIHIHKTNCPITAKEFKNYRWRQVKRNGEIVKLDEPLDKNNHCIDSIRYALEDLRLSTWVKPVKINRKRLGL